MSTCCNRVFHTFQMYVVYVLSGCCKNRSSVAYVAMAILICCKCMFEISTISNVGWSVLSRCCICCTAYTHILQVYVSNISAVCNTCCKCFIWMLHILQWPYTYVASVCCKCFICFGRTLQQMLYVPSVAWPGTGSGADGGGPLGRSGPRARGKRSGPDGPTYMRRCIHTVVAVGPGRSSSRQ
jgi:hypothetical protein